MAEITVNTKRATYNGPEFINGDMCTENGNHSAPKNAN